MADLILRTADGQEVGRRPMEAAERFIYYHACLARKPMAFLGLWYTITTVNWQMPQHALVLSVVWDETPRLRCGCAVGTCTCE